MRRTLAVLVTTAAFLAPAAAASATETHANASCSNSKGGNLAQQPSHTYNGKGQVGKVGTEEPCAGDHGVVTQPPAGDPPGSIINIAA